MDGYFLGDIKAVLNGCEDHWALQDKFSIPRLSQMTVCVNIRVVVPGPWVAFSYSSVRTLNPDFSLEGDDKAIYGWLLQVQHRFPFKMSPMVWHRVCLRRDVLRNIFSLEVRRSKIRLDSEFRFFFFKIKSLVYKSKHQRFQHFIC